MAAIFKYLEASANVKVGIGKLKGVFVSAGTNPTVAIYDSADTGTGNPIIAQFTPAAPGNYVFTGDEGGVGFSNGLYVVLGGTGPKVTVFYE